MFNADGCDPVGLSISGLLPLLLHSRFSDRTQTWLAEGAVSIGDMPYCRLTGRDLMYRYLGWYCYKLVCPP